MPEQSHSRNTDPSAIPRLDSESSALAAAHFIVSTVERTGSEIITRDRPIAMTRTAYNSSREESSTQNKSYDATLAEHLVYEAERSTMDTLDDLIDPSSSPEVVAHTMVSGLAERAKRGLVPPKWYTEIHRTAEGRTVVLPAPRKLVPFGATINGHHSLVDELRGIDGGEYPNFMNLADSLGVTTDTIVAKANMLVDDDGKVSLRIENTRKSDLSWLGDVTTAAENMGFDDGVEIVNDRRSGHGYTEAIQELDTDNIVTAVDISHTMYRPKESYQVPGQAVGVVSGLDIKSGWRRHHDGSYADRDAVVISVVESDFKNVMHNDLYKQIKPDAEGLQSGFVTFEYRGDTYEVAVRYSDTDKERSIMIFWAKEYPEGVSSRLTNMLVNGIGRSLNDLYTRDGPIEVTVASMGSTKDDDRYAWMQSKY